MISVLRIALVSIAFLFMAAVAIEQWSQIDIENWIFRFDLLGMSLAAAVVIFVLDAYGWRLILKTLGCELPTHRAIRVWFISSLSRYIPGGVWPYASRVVLAKEEGVDVVTASVSLYLETLLLATSSMAVGLLALVGGVGWPIHPLLVAAIFLALALPFHPGVLRLLGKLPGRVGMAMQQVRLPKMRHTIVLYIYYLIFWVMFGAVFVCFVSAIHPISPEYWIPVGASLAFGFFVGFIFIFAPGGIGVRESALYLLLLPFIPHAASLLVSIGSRLWLMAAEATTLAFVLLYGVLRARAGVKIKAAMPKR